MQALRKGKPFSALRPLALCLTLGAFACTAALADYPDKPIKLIVPWAPGGATDQIGRTLAHSLSQSMGVPVVVENKGGAGGNIGTQAFVKEKADGYTLLLATSSTNAAGPHLYASRALIRSRISRPLCCFAPFQT